MTSRFRIFTPNKIFGIIISRKMRTARHVASIGKRNAYMFLLGKPEGRRLFGRPTRGLDANIKTGPEDIGWEDLRRIDLAQKSDMLRAVSA
jgi:hypothetical protein